MTVSAQVAEMVAQATGFSRETVRDTFGEISTALGSKLGVLRQRLGGVMASTSVGGEPDIDRIYSETDNILTTGDRSRILGALGLGFIGGLLMAGAAGSAVVWLVGLLCLAMAGWLVLSLLQRLLARLSQLLDEAKNSLLG